MRCTALFWALRGGFPERSQNRQIRIVQDALRRRRLDWLGYIDVDEFLHTPRPVSDILVEVPADTPNLSMDAFEALHDPDLPDDIFTARHFHGTLRGDHVGLRPANFGHAADVLTGGSIGYTLS